MELMGVHGGYPVSREFEACFPVSRELEIVGYFFIYPNVIKHLLKELFKSDLCDDKSNPIVFVKINLLWR